MARIAQKTSRPCSRRANAKSILQVLSLGAGRGAEISIRAAGSDAEAAIDALKQLVALATVDAPHFAAGNVLSMEVTVEGTRHFVAATVVPTPFFRADRKTALPPHS